MVYSLTGDEDEEGKLNDELEIVGSRETHGAWYQGSGLHGKPVNPPHIADVATFVVDSMDAYEHHSSL